MANGWWNDNGAISGTVAAYQPIGAASLAASYSNLFSPGTNDAAPGTAPTFNTAGGWIFNGTTQWLDTGITRGSGYTMIVRVYATGDGVPMGGSDTRIVFMRVRGGDVVFINAAGQQIIVAPNALNVEVVLGMAGMVCYRAGVTTGTISGSDGGGAPISFGMSKTSIRPCACTIRAAAVYSGTLTGAQMATISGYMSNLPTLPTWGNPAMMRAKMAQKMGRR